MADIDVARWRREFPILETCTYLVSHSLGAMPKKTRTYLEQFANEWDGRGVRAWHEGWWEIGRETGNLLAPILGAAPNTISMHQNVTVAQAIIASSFRFEGPRRKIVMADLEFPTNMYVFEGFRKYGAQLEYVPSDDAIRTNLDRLLDAIDERTILVPLSLVLFRSAFVQNAAAVVEKAHRVGAHVILDVYQAAGTLPLDLTKLGVSFAVGGSVKWLCGGPGTGYLYVAPRLRGKLVPAITGWFAHEEPFEFATEHRLHEGDRRFWNGTPCIPAYFAARAGFAIAAEIGGEALREKSLRLTGRMIELADEHGLRVVSPREAAHRGGTVCLDVPNAEKVCARLLASDVLLDHRPGVGIRLAPHHYTRDDEVEDVMARVRAAVDAEN